jgi:hypothetical protein
MVPTSSSASSFPEELARAFFAAFMGLFLRPVLLDFFALLARACFAIFVSGPTTTQDALG